MLSHTVSRPSAQQAAAARPSSGTGASRWFSMVCSITTSQRSKASPVGGRGPASATFEVAAGNSSAGAASAAGTPTTGGRGS